MTGTRAHLLVASLLLALPASAVQGQVEVSAQGGATATSGAAAPSGAVAPSGAAATSGAVAPSGAATTATTSTVEAPAAVEPEPDDSDGSRNAVPRAHSSWFGPVGGIHVIDAGAGAPSTFRLALGLDMFSSGDFLVAGDDNNYLGGTLAFSYTPIDHLELFASLASHANSNIKDEPQLMQVLGDTLFGAKGFTSVEKWMRVGGDVRFVIPSTVGGVGPLYSAISVGLRANATADLRGIERPVPLVLRGSFDYLFDNSANLIEDVEAGRYLALGTDRNSPRLERRHLVRRIERFALGINRTDALGLALGVEVPLAASERVFLHPLLEWTLALPVNRQGYACVLVETPADAASEDGCLAIEGLAAMASTLTLGLRAYPGLAGLALTAGVDIGISGTSTFVRELAPNRPYAVLLSLAYDMDSSARTRTVPVEVVREVRIPPPEKARVQGSVVDSSTGAGVAEARVAYPDLGLTAQQSDASGQFVSYGLDQGPLRLEVSHRDYEPGTCGLDVPAPAGAPRTKPKSLATPREATEGPTAHNPYLGPTHPSHSAPLTLRCELTPRPRLGALKGRVSSEAPAPVGAASVELQGPSTLRLTTDAVGEFAQLELPAGRYGVRVEAEGYLLRQVTVDIAAGQTADVAITLVQKPKEAQVELTTQEVRIRKQVFFKTNSAEISETSNQLLSEIADVLLRNPQVKLVEIQGHTDNTGSPDLNLTLSQARADAVRTWLVGGGIDEGRLTAKGYGDERPLVPNLTERARARNRRVQLVIREQP